MKASPIRKHFLYRNLASIKTTVYLLSIIFVLFLIGTIFPQGVDVTSYEDAGGKFVFAAKYLGFLHIFETPLFLLSGFLLALNTIVCTVERLITLAKKERSVPAFGRKGQRRYQTSDGVAIPKLEEELIIFLKKRGFRLRHREETSSGSSLAFNKGLHLPFMSILFHAGIFICILLFFSTHYFAYENYLTIYPGETKEVTLPGEKSAPFRLKLNRFSTIYEDNPIIDFPGKAHLKIAAIIEKPGERAAFKLEGGSIAVSDWVSDVSVLEGDRELANKEVEVNVPLRYGGFTFYQMGYDQEVELLVDGRKVIISPGKPFDGNNNEKLTISSVKHGKLYKLDGTTEKVEPYVTLLRFKEGGSRKSREKLGDLPMGKKRKIAGIPLQLVDFKEASVLSYRVDPSVNILYYLSFLVTALIAARLYLRRSRLHLEISPREGSVAVVTKIRGEGAIYFPDVEEKKVQNAMEEAGLVETGPNNNQLPSDPSTEW